MADNYALGGDHHTTTTTSANFIPELWSDEVIGAYKSNLVLANLVTKLSHKGKKGDTIHIRKSYLRCSSYCRCEHQQALRILEVNRGHRRSTSFSFNA